MFWNVFYSLCEQKNLKPNNVAKAIGVSSGVITKWKQGSIPKIDALIKLSDYFSVSIDILLGRENKSSPSELTENEQEIVKIFKDLTETQQGKIIARAQIMAEQNEAEFLRKEG